MGVGMLATLRAARWFFICVAAGFLSLSPMLSQKALAQSDADPVEYEEDYDFSWLDPDKKIYVVQNRKYLKGRRIELSIGAGVNISGPYTSANVVLARGGYFFNEQFGVAAVGGWQSNSPSDTLTELKLASSVIPNIREVTNFYGGAFVWVPFYGKFNLFNQIVYVDWALEAGVASISSNVNLNFASGGADQFLTDSQTGFFWGTGFKFFITQMFAARLDMLALYYSAPIYRQGVITSTSTTYDNYYFTLGVSAHF